MTSIKRVGIQLCYRGMRFVQIMLESSEAFQLSTDIKKFLLRITNLLDILGILKQFKDPLKWMTMNISFSEYCNKLAQNAWNPAEEVYTAAYRKSYRIFPKGLSIYFLVPIMAWNWKSLKNFYSRNPSFVSGFRSLWKWLL